MRERVFFCYMRIASFKSFGGQRENIFMPIICGSVYSNQNIDRKIDLHANTSAINHIVRLLSFEIFTLSDIPSLFFSVARSFTHTNLRTCSVFFFGSNVCLLNFRFSGVLKVFAYSEARETYFPLSYTSAHTLKWRIEFIWILIIIYTFIQSIIFSS